MLPNTLTVECRGSKFLIFDKPDVISDGLRSGVGHDAWLEYYSTILVGDNKDGVILDIGSNIGTTTTNAVEAYINGVWEVVRASGATAIQVSRLPANGTETTFGPLNATYVTNYTASDYNLMVLIDNVMQIGNKINYTVVKRQAGSFVSVTNSPFSASGPGTYTNDEYYIQFPTADPPPAFSGTGDPIYVTVFYGYGN